MKNRILRSIARAVLGEPSARLQQRIYREARRLFTIDQPEFPRALKIPAHLGMNLPERVIELALAKYTYVPGSRVLDVGHSNIMECHRRLLRSLEEPRHLTGIDIANPTYDTTEFYEQSIRADITATGLPDKSFDLIWCISTIEHVGMDNSCYTDDFSTGAGMDLLALREMERLLVPSGMLLLTVPFGIFENHGWLKNYDKDTWQTLLSVVSRRSKKCELYFKYSPAVGWHVVEPSQLAATRYYENENAGASGLAAVIITTQAS
jgi:SAM-dependent methyltransferase